MIRLDGGYAIDVDKYCYILGKPKMKTEVNKKTKEEVTKEVLTDCKYYSTFDAALLGFWREIRKTSLYEFEGSLKEALKRIEAQDEKIRKMIERYKIGKDAEN